jgi:AcrR family transcriptional regulator
MPAAQRREVILGAAEETFARCGYHGASLDEVAHAAGVSKALIYEHFDSKRELHASLLDAHAREIFARLQAGAERGETGEQRLRSGIDAFLRWVEEHREAWRALFRDAADPEVAALVGRLQGQATAVIAHLVASDPGAAPGLAGVDPDRALRLEIHAQLLSGAVQSLATWWDEHREIPRRMLVDRAMDFCHRGGPPTPMPAAPARTPVGAPVR